MYYVMLFYNLCNNILFNDKNNKMIKNKIEKTNWMNELINWIYDNKLCNKQFPFLDINDAVEHFDFG